jgi:uncharacterized protein (TIRG00374 family)
MKKKMIIGTALSALFVYLSLKGIDPASVAEGFRAVNYGYIGPVLFLLLLIQILRSYRWGLLLSPFEKIGQFDLFAVTSVGFLAVVAVPARIGELARPYLITGKSSIRMAAALGTVVVERVFDILTVLAIFFGVLFFMPLPPWLMKASILFLVMTLATLFFLIFIILKREKALNTLRPLLQKLPERFHHRLDDLLHHFIDGVAILSEGRMIFFVILLSLLIWLVDVLAIYLLFLSFGFHLPTAASFVLMAILIIGITIPTAPGFVGNFHYFCILGLSLFGISKADALSYAIVLHVLSVGLIVVLGLGFLPFNRFSVADIKARFDINGQSSSL